MSNSPTPEEERTLGIRPDRDGNLPGDEARSIRAMLDSTTQRLRRLENLGSDYRLSLAQDERWRRERRYALLQAAAIIDSSPPYATAAASEVVDRSEELLEEIKRREKKETT